MIGAVVTTVGATGREESVQTQDADIQATPGMSLVVIQGQP